MQQRTFVSNRLKSLTRILRAKPKIESRTAWKPVEATDVPSQERVTCLMSFPPTGAYRQNVTKINDPATSPPDLVDEPGIGSLEFVELAAGRSEPRIVIYNLLTLLWTESFVFTICYTSVYSCTHTSEPVQHDKQL